MLVIAASFSRRRRGFSLIELACVLAVIAVLVAGVMLLYGSAQEAKLDNDLVTELEQVVAAGHSLSQGSADYSNVSESVIAQSGLLPSRYVDPTHQFVITPWSVPMTILPQPKYTSGNDVLQVRLSNLTRSACIKLATEDFGEVSWSRSVNGTDTWDKAETPAQANSACLYGSTNAVAFNFN